MRSLTFTVAIAVLTLAVAASVSIAEDAPDLTIRTQPYKILLKAAMLLPATGEPLITAQEALLFEDAADGHVDKLNMVDVVLISSGVTDQQSRNRYVKKINAITKDARRAIADGKTPKDKADLLAHHLFKGPLHGGYADCQVDFLLLLNDGKFNCVSSSLLYNLVGSQLGLKTNCESCPNHVFLVMDDLVIEPVGGYTCTKRQHQKTVDQCWNTSPEFSKAVFTKSHTYLSSNAGLIAMIYVDRSSQFHKEHKIAESAIEALKACCMDSVNPSFRLSAECQLAAWFQSAIEAHDLALASSIAKVYCDFFANPPQGGTMQRVIDKARAQLASR